MQDLGSVPSIFTYKEILNSVSSISLKVSLMRNDRKELIMKFWRVVASRILNTVNDIDQSDSV